MAKAVQLHDLNSRTIDAAQASEAQSMILSTVRDGGELGFLDSSSRINVATSRQKTAMFIVGNYETVMSAAPHHVGYLSVTLTSSLLISDCFVAL